MVGDNIFNVTKGKSKDYYTLLIREKAKPPNIIQKLQSNFLTATTLYRCGIVLK